MNEGCPMLTAMRKLWAEEVCICAAADGSRYVLDAINAEVAHQTEPAIDVAGQSAGKSMPVERLFGAGIGAEANEGVSDEEINRGIAFTGAGRLGLRRLGLGRFG